MAVKILMPKLGLTMKTGTVVRWLKAEGEAVAEKEPVLEIETEKLSHQIESPAAGILLRRLALEGEKYPIAAVVGYVGQAGEVLEIPEAEPPAGAPSPGPGPAAEPEKAVPPAAPAAGDGKRIFISPVAKRLAAQRGIDYTRIRGTGPNGRIVKADVEGYRPAPAVVSWARPTAEDRRIPYAGMRRAIGENMLRAWTGVPMVTHHVQVDAGPLLAYRALLNDGVEERGERVSVNDLLLKLTAGALVRMPAVNAALLGDEIVRHSRVHLGMATALEDGLIVPVIRDADRKGLLAVSREAKDLAARARSGALTPDDLEGATFTVSNLGGYGSVDFFTPIVNPPQAAILGVGRVVDTAVPVDGEVTIRPMLGLSFTYDHRVIDGAAAAQFIKLLMDLMARPARAALD